VGFEPTISAGERLKTYALDRAATGKGYKFILALESNGKIALHMAAEKDQLELLHIVWEWAKQVLTQEELNNYLNLAENISEATSWHMAAEKGEVDTLHKVWEWAKKYYHPKS